MSPRRHFGLLLTALLMLSLVAAAPTLASPSSAGAAKAKKCKKGYKHPSKKSKKCVKIKKKAAAPIKVPVAVDFLEGSKAMIDVGGAVRDVPLKGRLTGFIAGKIDLTKDTTVQLSGGEIKPGVADLLTADCKGTQVVTARLNPASVVKLDPAAKNTATLKVSGDVSAQATTIIRYVLDVPNGDCSAPLVPAGYSDLPASFALSGKLNPQTGLTALALDSPPVPYTAGLCTTPGDPLQPCGGALTQMPITIATHLVSAVDLSPQP
jgi:hypothetical protein